MPAQGCPATQSHVHAGRRSISALACIYEDVLGCIGCGQQCIYIPRPLCTCVHTHWRVCAGVHSCTCVPASGRGSTRREMLLKQLFSPWAFKHQANLKTEGESQCWSWGSRACAEAVTAISLSAAGLPPDSQGQEGVFSSGFCRLLCLLAWCSPAAAPPEFPGDRT